MIENKKLWRVIKQTGKINLSALNAVLSRNGYDSITGLQISSVEVLILATNEQIQHLKEVGEFEIYSEYSPEGQIDSYLLRLNTCLLLELIDSVK